MSARCRLSQRLSRRGWLHVLAANERHHIAGQSGRFGAGRGRRSAGRHSRVGASDCIGSGERHCRLAVGRRIDGRVHRNVSASCVRGKHLSDISFASNWVLISVSRLQEREVLVAMGGGAVIFAVLTLLGAKAVTIVSSSIVGTAMMVASVDFFMHGLKTFAWVSTNAYTVQSFDS